MNEDNVCLWDMDGSLCDYSGAMYESLLKLQSPNDPPLTKDNMWRLEADHMNERRRLIKNQPGWWLNLKPIVKGFSVFKLAKDLGFHNQILTKGPKKHSLAWQEKVQWCAKHFGDEVDVSVVCGKGGTYGKVLYDDFPDYVEAWLKWRPRGLVIMPVDNYTPSHPIYDHENVIEWDGKQETYDYIGRMLKRVLERKPGEELNLSE